MIETIRLFDEDSHQTLFEGCVLSCEQDGDLYKITLNQTMFFPEEGGHRLCRLGEAFLRYASAYGRAYCIRTYS